MKKLLFLFVFMLIIPFNVNADCEYTEQRELLDLSQHIDYTYEYSRDIYYFNVTFYNVVPELKLVYNGQNFTGLNNRVVINNLTDSDEKVQVYGSNTSNCPNTYIKDVDLNLPVYNVFYESNDCKEYPDFKYCVEFLAEEISEEEFGTELSNYIVEEDLENYSSESNRENEFLNFKNIILVFVAMLILVVIVIFVVKILKLKKL